MRVAQRLRTPALCGDSRGRLERSGGLLTPLDGEHDRIERVLGEEKSSIDK